MKINLVFLTILLCGGFLITGCEKSNGTIYQVKEECQDGGCKGRFGAWYIKNTSYDKTIRFIIQLKEIDDSEELSALADGMPTEIMHSLFKAVALSTLIGTFSVGTNLQIINPTSVPTGFINMEDIDEQ